MHISDMFDFIIYFLLLIDRKEHIFMLYEIPSFLF